MKIEYIPSEDVRRRNGIEIAKRGGLQRRGDDAWLVPSQKGSNFYLVYFNGKESTCKCAFFEKHELLCKHIYAVEETLKMQNPPEYGGGVLKTKRVYYPRNWKAYDKSRISEKGDFIEHLKGLLENIDEPKYKFGRPKMSLRSLLFASALKVYTKATLENTATDLKAFGYIDATPSPSSIAKFMRSEEATSMLQKLIGDTTQPFINIEDCFAVDSTGFRITKFTDYFYNKYEFRRAHSWIKAHCIVGVKTHVVTAVIVGEEFSADSPNFEPLVKQTHKLGFTIKEVSADKAYSSRKNLECVDKLGGTPYIPFKSLTLSRPNYLRGRPRNKLWDREEHIFSAFPELWKPKYNKRSNVETAFSMMKRRFGDCLESKSKRAQINETLLKILCHNIVVVIQAINELGVKAEFNTNAETENEPMGFGFYPTRYAFPAS